MLFYQTPYRGKYRGSWSEVSSSYYQKSSIVLKLFFFGGLVARHEAWPTDIVKSNITNNNQGPRSEFNKRVSSYHFWAKMRLVNAVCLLGVVKEMSWSTGFINRDQAGQLCYLQQNVHPSPPPKERNILFLSSSDF